MQDLLPAVEAISAEFPHVQALSLVGSRATGAAGPLGVPALGWREVQVPGPMSDPRGTVGLGWGHGT